VRDGTSRGLDMLVNFAMMARSVLFNGLGRYSGAGDVLTPAARAQALSRAS